MSELLFVYRSFVSLNQIYLWIYSFTLTKIYILHTNHYPFFCGLVGEDIKSFMFTKKVSEKLFALAET
jgi:hypothetical protein